jgi:hypothetical protein
LVEDQKLPASVRVVIARKWFAAVRSRSANGRSKIGNAANARATERPAPFNGGAANGTALSATRAAAATSPTTDLLMLPVLLRIVQEEAIQPAERRTAA